MPRVHSIRPMLAVGNLSDTIRFYVEKLGFNCNSLFGDPPVWCDLDRDGQSIMFNAPPHESVEGDVPRASKNYQIFYFNVDDVAAFHAELASRGVPVTPLRVTVDGMKEFEVRDDWLWFGQPTDEPPTPGLA